MNQRPEPDEYTSFYGGYVDHVPDGDVLEFLEDQAERLTGLIGELPPEAGDRRYAPDKWTLKEVLGHISDSERVLAYRALRFARADLTPLPGYEQDPWVEAAGFQGRILVELMADFLTVRSASLSLFRTFDGEALDRKGMANDREITVRALVWVTAGHAEHHLETIRDRYLEMG